MNQNPNPLPKQTPQKPEVRRKGRLRCDSLMSSLGEVLDLSASGMRVTRKGKPIVEVEQAVQCTLECEALTLTVDTRVIWIRKVGFRTYEIGLTFENVTESITRQISYLARGAAKRETLRDTA